ncbi:HAD-IIA family hydrolase [Bacteroidota bacterium]
MKPLLIDLDGVLRLGTSPAPGLKDFISFLEVTKRPACIISNSTRTNSELLLDFFNNISIKLKFPIMTAADVTYSYVKNNYKKVVVYASDVVKNMLRDFRDMKSPEAVIIGDLGSEWNFQILNEIFNYVIDGCDIIAMHKNRYWRIPEKGYVLDAGPFVTAIEYAANRESKLIGKPSSVYFNSALRVLGYSEGEPFIMIGDDVETDIKGAADLDGETILIYTGKTKYPLEKKAIITPDHEAKDLVEAIKILRKIN